MRSGYFAKAGRRACFHSKKFIEEVDFKKYWNIVMLLCLHRVIGNIPLKFYAP